MKFELARLYLMLAILFSCISPWGAVQADSQLTLAVHPFLSPEEIEKKFNPLVDYISRQTGLDINVRIGSSYDEHIGYIGSDKVDIAYMGPASYVAMVHRFGDKPILAKLNVKGRSYFQGNIITRKDSGIRTLDDLRGKRFAFGDPNSTMSYIVPHYMLHQAGVFDSKTNKHQFLHSHNNVALGVLSGDYDAGAVKPAVFKRYEAKGLRMVAVTPKISEHLFITRVNLPVGQVQSIRKAMLNMGKSPEGLAALQTIKKTITGLVAAESSDYDNLRKIILGSENLHSD